MNRTQHIHLMATYNQWMNTRLYQAAGNLPDEELVADRKAFFGSILGTLNHLALGDRVWLQRFARHPANYPLLEPIRQLPAPGNLKELQFTDIRDLEAHRLWLDQLIIEWAGSITEADLDHPLQYANMKGVPAQRDFFGLIMHFFNHQTHHRGQVTTLLSQAGIDPGDTDLLFVMPSEPAA